jgi:poly-gamma-glutamate synthesis protein (capsule biosynthesis protein)
MKKITIISIILLLSSCSNQTEVIKITPTIKPIKTPIITPLIEDNNLSFITFGDALIHGGVYLDAKTNKYDENNFPIYDFSKQLANLKPLIKDYDVKYYNQESIIGGKKLGISSYPAFNTPDEFGNAMVDLGFNLVNLANNHTLDKGSKGIEYSLNYWKEQQVQTIGSYNSQNERDNIQIIEKNNIKYAVIAYTYGTNGLTPEFPYYVNIWNQLNKEEYEAYKEQVLKDINFVRDKVDILIVSMHWGTEYTHNPNSFQKDSANFLANNGVNVIIGSHPHTIQPVEYIGDTLVIYSLGNLISAQNDQQNRIGAFVGFNINKHTENGVTTIKINNVKADLLYLYFEEKHRNTIIIPFKDLDETHLKNHKYIYNKYLKILNMN